MPLSKPDCVTEPEPSPSKPEYPIKSLTVNNGFSNFAVPSPNPVNNSLNPPPIEPRD